MRSVMGRTRLLIIAAMATLPCNAPQVHGQGARPLLPDPIATADLIRYAEQLHLSQPQLQAAFEMHDQYKADFRTLNEGEIQGFVNRIHALFVTGSAQTPKRMQDVGGEISMLTNKISALDDHFFNELAAVLTPAQVSALPRARWARQRECISMASTNYRPVLNVGELAREIDVVPETRAALNPVLFDYEQKLTGIVVELRQVDWRATWDLAQTLKDRGIADNDLDQPEDAAVFAEARKQAASENEKEVHALLKQGKALNESTINALAAALPPAAAHELRLTYYCERDSGFTLEDHDACFEAALRGEDLSNQQRAALTSARGELQRATAGIIVRALAFDRDFENKNDIDWQDLDLERRRTLIAEHYNVVQGYQQEMAKAQSAAREALAGILGEGEGARLATFATFFTADVSERRRRAAQNTSPAPPPDEPLDPGFETIRQFAYLKLSELAGLFEKLNLDEARRARIAQLHQAYREHLRSIAQREVQAIDAAHRATLVQSEAGDVRVTATAEQIDKLQQCQRAAVVALRSADDALLDGLASFDTSGAHAAAIERLRQRAYRRHLCKFCGTHEISEYDMEWFLRKVPLSPDERATIEQLLAEHDSQLTEIVEAICRAEMQWRKSHALSSAAGNAQRRHKTALDTASKKKTEAINRLAELHKNTIDAMVEALPVNAALTMRREFNLRMHPETYYDPASVDRQIHQALVQLALTPSQRESLESLAADYRPAYAEMCEQLAQLETSARGASNPRNISPKQRVRQAVLTFERAELNHRAASKLRWILSPEQLQSIGGLPPLERKP